MVKYKEVIFLILIFIFLLFSFSPTIFELQKAHQLTDPAREFILEHNYYWPDFNLYLSKIRQGYEGRATAVEKYTSEKHTGSLLQEFYLILGHLGRLLSLDPNFSYQLGRLILSPLLLLVILLLVRFCFKSFFWQLVAFLTTVASGSFPRFYTDSGGVIHIGRFMEWWSNIDALQRITFIPHILFAQVASFYLLYQLTTHHSRRRPPAGGLWRRTAQLTTKKLVFYILLGNAVGLVFPPSLITLNGVIFLTLLISFVRSKTKDQRSKPNAKLKALNFKLGFDFCTLRFALSSQFNNYLFFVIFTLPSLLYLFFITKTIPWSALVDFHRTHPMMIPFDQYLLGTGPIFILGMLGAMVSIFKRERGFQPLIFWILVTFSFAALFSVVKEQSPLRFTQTGLFIPLGILGTYLFQQIYQGVPLQTLQTARGPLIKGFLILFLVFYLLLSLYMMKVSYDWQTTWISQRIGASIPAVPYPPQTMYPLKEWVDGIRWLRDATNHDEVVLAEITAGNYIPAYSGNTVYFGQANTVDYNRKQLEMEQFFSGKMTIPQAKDFLKNGRIKYIFFSLQEKERGGGQELQQFYPFLRPTFSNSLVTTYLIPQ